jgi:hypothetical protein
METQKCKTPEYGSVSRRFLRVYAMMIGHLVLLYWAVVIPQSRSACVGTADAFYWATVGILLLARHVDIQYLQGRTADGGPASLADWRHYAVFLLVVSTTLWLFVNAVAYLWLPPA